LHKELLRLNQKILKRTVTAGPLIRILCVRDHITLRTMPRSIDHIVSWHVMLVSNPLTQISLPFVHHASPLLVRISVFDAIPAQRADGHAEFSNSA
jgi:uncharacterized protein YdgA (DUF945 family)